MARVDSGSDTEGSDCCSVVGCVSVKGFPPANIKACLHSGVPLFEPWEHEHSSYNYLDVQLSLVYCRG